MEKMQIVKPFGPVARRVVIECDVRGTVRMESLNEELRALTGVKQAPMHALEVMGLLTNVLGDLIRLMTEGINKQANQIVGGLRHGETPKSSD